MQLKYITEGHSYKSTRKYTSGGRYIRTKDRATLYTTTPESWSIEVKVIDAAGQDWQCVHVDGGFILPEGGIEALVAGMRDKCEQAARKCHAKYSDADIPFVGFEVLVYHYPAYQRDKCGKCVHSQRFELVEVTDELKAQAEAALAAWRLAEEARRAEESARVKAERRATYARIAEQHIEHISNQYGEAFRVKWGTNTPTAWVKTRELAIERFVSKWA